MWRLGSRAKLLVATLLWATGILAALRRWRSRRGDVAVLAFHRIAGTPDAPLPLAFPADWLSTLIHEATRRYHIGAWQTCMQGSPEVDRPRLALTFDDGYREHAEIAWPALRQAGATGIFCLSTAIVDGTECFWWSLVAARKPLPAGSRPSIDRGGNAKYSPAAEAEIARLKTLPVAEFRQCIAALHAAARPAELAELPAAMTWADAQRMLSEGAEITAHGATHAILTNCDDAELADELEEGRRVITAQLGVAPLLLAYPNGDHDERVAAAARRAGFEGAFAAGNRYYRRGGDPMRVPRIAVSPAMCSANGRTFSWPLFETEMLGVFDLLLFRHRRRSRS